MAGVINEFEVVPGEAPPGKQSGAQSSAESAPSPPPQEELERLIEQEHERRQRVWAH